MTRSEPPADIVERLRKWIAQVTGYVTPFEVQLLNEALAEIESLRTSSSLGGIEGGVASRLRAAPQVQDAAIEVLKEIMQALRIPAPGTPLNNHSFDALGSRAYAAIAAYEKVPAGALTAEKADAFDTATARECWERINAHIVRGELPGNGCDQSAQRNGMILATNILFPFAFPEVAEVAVAEQVRSSEACPWHRDDLKGDTERRTAIALYCKAVGKTEEELS